MLIKELYADGASRIARILLDTSDSVKASDGAVLVFLHKSVDGDCVGSACAAVSLFRHLGVKAKVAMPEMLPDSMSFLGVDDLLAYIEDPEAEEITVDGKKVIQVLSVDCTEGDRMGSVGAIYNRFEDAITVDHHEVTHLANDRKWIEPQASSACEMMFYVAAKLAEAEGRDLRDVLDRRAAMCLITGMVTDTGRFTYSNTRSETLAAAGELMDLGGNIMDVCHNLFDKKTITEFRISNQACVNAEFYADGKLAITTVSEEMYKRFNAGKDDVSDVVSRLRDIAGVELAVVLRENDEGAIRANLRSKTTFDCSEFAGRYDGGGHKRAAGFTVKGRDLDSVKDEVVREASCIL